MDSPGRPIDSSPVTRQNTGVGGNTLDRQHVNTSSHDEGETFNSNAVDVQAMAEMTVNNGENDDELAAVKNVLYHMDRPFENLPPLVSPEMKIIGRCVCFKGDTMINGEVKTMYYEGLVNTITKNSVTLMHVFRYTEEDFKTKKAMEESEKSKATTAATTPTTTPTTQHAPGSIGDSSPKEGNENASKAPPPPATQTLRTSEDVLNHARLHAKKKEEPLPHDDIFLSCPPPSADKLPAAANAHPREGDEPHSEPEPTCEGRLVGSPVSAHSATYFQPYGSEPYSDDTCLDIKDSTRNKLKGHDGTLGPLPYITFQRFHIHDVQFGHDPRSQFYSLFSKPERKIFDMQCLRMFVRRFIIHTSQNNNLRQVPLRRFIVSRCNCPSVDDALLVSIAREEVLHLVKVDREMRKKSEQQVTRVLREYRAPAGLFHNTGILYLTRIPMQTFLVGILEFAMVVVFVIYSAVSFQTCEYLIMYQVLVSHLAVIISLSVVSLIACFFTCAHSVRMRIPLSGSISILFARVLCVSGGIVCCIITIVRMIKGFSAYLYKLVLMTPTSRICEYYVRKGCTGFYNNCKAAREGSMEAQICDSCTRAGYFVMDIVATCGDSIHAENERVMIPFVAFAVVLLILFCVDHFLLAKLYGLVRMITRNGVNQNA